eukprot:TRINITY_DN4546_c0_g3_i1.p1 TRINITY_DN4546_c0_g3~~TRINITY_DN4546_c0_g3_i1.p1  ORF type:complete len:657 (+),score=221.04 TRINITY_DN4546_c0_g3_i1:35-1972(+)
MNRVPMSRAALVRESAGRARWMRSGSSKRGSDGGVFSASTTPGPGHEAPLRRYTASAKLPHHHHSAVGVAEFHEEASPCPDTSADAASPTSDTIDFTNAREAFKNKSTAQILLAILVFRASTVGPLVRNADSLISAATKIFGNYLVNGVVVKRTFFGHFCGGETVSELEPFIAELKQIGVGAILDYAAEADVPESADQDENDVRYHRSSEGVNSARVYDYHGEAECDANAQTILECISHASHLDKEGAFCAIKLTALCKPKVLEKMSLLLMSARRSWVEGFAHIEARNRESLLSRPAQEIRSIVSCPIKMRGVDLAGWKEGLSRICVDKKPTDEEAERMFDALKNSDGTVDYLDYTRKVTLESLQVSFAGAGDEDCPDLTVMRPLTHSGALPLLDEVESKLLSNMVRRINSIAALAVAEQVNVMIDAEQTYMQVAIDHFATMLQRIYNKEHPRIYNTYQCYLTYSKMRILNDLERSKREGWKFAGKLVRGAYMVQERSLAEEHGYASPIYSTIEDTHRNFDECVDIILKQKPESDIGLMIGSHNQHSIQETLRIMHQRGINKHDGGVYFGQLLGMADQLTFPLGQHGYKVYKYVPYGPVHEVMPYLIRRAQENSSMNALSESELGLLQAELKRRVSSLFSRASLA